MSRLRLAVFDCDGTLVDSQATILQLLSTAFAAEGLAVPADDAIRRTIGLPLETAIASLIPGETIERVRRVREGYRTASRQMVLRPDHAEPLFEGTRDALDRLMADGWLLAVATGKGRRGLLATLERHGLMGHFLSLHTADDGPGKPDPDMLYKAMSIAGVTGADTVMIGDTSFDMAMARNAGTRALGVAWGYHPAAELLQSGAETVLDTYADLAALLIGERA